MNGEIKETQEVLMRQIHPQFYAHGVPSDCRFRPSKKDENKLSVDRNSLITSEKSYHQYTQRLKSAAVYGVTVEEFNQENINCYSDPLTENTAHALADYKNVQNIKLAAKRLKLKAIARGCLYP